MSTSSNTQQLKFNKYDVISVKENDKWFDAVVIEVLDSRIKIHFQGYASGYDKQINVSSDSIRKWSNNATNELQKQLNQSEKKNRDLQIKSQRLEREKNSWKKQLIQSKTINQSLRQQIKTIEQSIIASQTENESLKRNVSKLEKEMNAADEFKQGEIYKRNDILSHTSKQKQLIKPRDNIYQKQNQFNQIFIKHDTNMTDWMTFTHKMNTEYTQCKNDIQNKQKVTPSIILAPYTQCKLLWQQQQNQMESIADILRKFGRQKRELKSCVKSHNEKALNENNNYKETLNKYNQMNERRMKLENELKTKLKELNNCCDEENKLDKSQCNLLDSYNTFDIELKEYESILQHCNKLIKKYREFDSVNDKSIKEMQTYFENKWIESMKTWYKWDAESIINWIQYLREIGQLMLSPNIKLNEILKQMQKDKVDGNSLLNIDKNDLKSIGFEILSDRQRVFDQIQQLISKYPHPSNYQDEGKHDDDNTVEYAIKIPPEFICPLSKQIMNEPCVIFDGITYERSEIEEYLNKHKKSPNGEECDEDDMCVTPDRKLKQKIDAFLSVNPQFKQIH